METYIGRVNEQRKGTGSEFSLFTLFSMEARTKNEKKKAKKTKRILVTGSRIYMGIKKDECHKGPLRSHNGMTFMHQSVGP